MTCVACDMPATLICESPDGEKPTCSDCGPQLGWEIVSAIRGGEE